MNTVLLNCAIQTTSGRLQSAANETLSTLQQSMHSSRVSLIFEHHVLCKPIIFVHSSYHERNTCHKYRTSYPASIFLSYILSWAYFPFQLDIFEVLTGRQTHTNILSQEMRSGQQILKACRNRLELKLERKFRRDKPTFKEQN